MCLPIAGGINSNQKMWGQTAFLHFKQAPEDADAALQTQPVMNSTSDPDPKVNNCQISI